MVGRSGIVVGLVALLVPLAADRVTSPLPVGSIAYPQLSSGPTWRAATFTVEDHPLEVVMWHIRGQACAGWEDSALDREAPDGESIVCYRTSPRLAEWVGADAMDEATVATGGVPSDVRSVVVSYMTAQTGNVRSVRVGTVSTPADLSHRYWFLPLPRGVHKVRDVVA